MSTYRSLALLLCLAAVTACEKNAVQDITAPLPSARIKFFNFGVNAPAVNFYAGERKMTAIFSSTGTESTAGTAYGVGAAGGLYTGIEPGQHTLSGRIAGATDKDLPISELAATIEDGKKYSFYQSGFYDPETKTVDAFIVEDPFSEEFDYSVAKVRLVNAIANAEPLILHAALRDTVLDEFVVGAAVPYKSAGAFTDLPNGVYDLTARYEDGTVAISRTGVSFSAGRIYTMTARGDITVTTGTNAAVLDLRLNR